MPGKPFKQYTAKDFGNEIRKYRAEYAREMLIEFYDYWSEAQEGVTKSKMKFQYEKTWNTPLRLKRWERNQRSNVNVKYPKTTGWKYNPAKDEW